jgi:NAD(P)-dependent dehydrogenase (short-subunit alcohol dehydrogenase family)
MANPKVWVVMGATEGLGLAAIKYLVLKKQRVIALIVNDPGASHIYETMPENLQVVYVDTSNLQVLRKDLKKVIRQYGLIDFIINNSNYKLFDRSGEDSEHLQSQNSITVNISETIALLKELLPYFRKHSIGSVINIPPQLCLATVNDKAEANRLTVTMEIFLKNLHKELKSLDCPLNFLEPGERLKDFAV